MLDDKFAIGLMTLTDGQDKYELHFYAMKAKHLHHTHVSGTCFIASEQIYFAKDITKESKRDVLININRIDIALIHLSLQIV